MDSTEGAGRGWIALAGLAFVALILGLLALVLLGDDGSDEPALTAEAPPARAARVRRGGAGADAPAGARGGDEESGEQRDGTPRPPPGGNVSGGVILGSASVYAQETPTPLAALDLAWPPPLPGAAAPTAHSRGVSRATPNEGPATLRVRVASATTEEVLDGASVRIEGSSDVVHEVHCDALGEATVAGLEPGRWRVEVDAARHVPYCTQVSLRGAQETVVDVHLEVGVVLEAQLDLVGGNRPVGGVDVAVYDRKAWLDSIPLGPAAPLIVRGSSDSEGRAVLDSLPRLRDLVVVARAPGYATATKLLTTGVDHRSIALTSLVMMSGAALHGRVLASGPEEVPVRGAHVFAVSGPIPVRFKDYGEEPRSRAEVDALNLLHLLHVEMDSRLRGGIAASRVRTDAEGRFRIEGLRSGRKYSLVAFSGRGVSTEYVAPLLAGSSASTRLQLRGMTTVDFKGRDGGRVVTGLDVTSPWSALRLSARSGAGKVTPRVSVPAGPLVVLGGSPRHPRSLYVMWNRESIVNTVTLTLADGAEISGRVSERDGDPLSSASVDVGGRSVTTDADGAFSVAAREGRSYAVEISASGYLPWRRKEVTAPDRDIDAGLRRSASVTAQLVLPTGATPPAWIAIAPRGDEASIDRDLVTHRLRWEGGAIRVDGVAAGTVVLYVTAAGYRIERRTVEVAAGEVADVGEIELDPGYPLRCQVVDGLGAIVPGALVDVRPSTQFALAPRLTLRADASGRVEAVVPRASISLTARAPDLPLTTKDVNLAENDAPASVRLVMERFVSIRGVVRDDDGNAVPGVQILVSEAGGAATGRGTVSGEGGAFRVTVPDRPCMLQVEFKKEGLWTGQLRVDRPSVTRTGLKIVVTR